MSARASLVLVLLLATPLAAAHVTRTSGEYSLKVGWLREPAATDERNAVTLELWRTATGEHTAGLGSQLGVTITFAGQTKALAMEESDEEPGHYAAPIVLTSPGVYKVHVEGRVGSNQVSQDFQIEVVKDIHEESFPAQNGGVSNAEVQREVQQLRDDVDRLKQQQSNRVPGFEPMLLLALVPLAAFALRRRA